MIAFVSQPYHRGGVTKWIKDAFVYLSNNGCDPYCVTVVPDKPIFQGSSPLFYEIVSKKHGTHVIKQQVTTKFELGNTASRAHEYRKAVVGNVPESYILIPSDDEACWLACCQLADRYKVIVVIHSYGDEFYYNLLKKYSRSISGIVCVSKKIYKKVLTVIPSFSQAAVTIIPCGIPVSEYYCAKKKANNIVWLGRLEEESKRVSDIPKIARLLKDQGTEFSLQVIGNGPLYRLLADEIRKLDLAEYVQLQGWVDDRGVKSALSEAGVLLQTSNYEGMSIAVMEALASGCQVVSSRVSGVEDINSRNVNLYPVGDVNQAVASIHNAFNNVFETQASQTVAETIFSIDICMRSYISFGKDLQFAEPFVLPFTRLNQLLGRVMALSRLLKRAFTK